MPAKSVSEPYDIVSYRGKYALAIGRGASRRRISTGTNDEGLARSIAQRIWSKINEVESGRVEDLWRVYLCDREKDGRDTTRQRNAWKHLGRVFGQRLGNDIRKDDCREHAASRKRQGVSSGTARIELEYLRACLSLKYGRGTNQVWVPPQGAPRDRYLTREEFGRLLDHVQTPHVRLFIILAVATGARMGAILELTWDQVDFKHRTINFNAENREQTNKRRPVVPMNNRAQEALQEAVGGALTNYVIEWDGKPVKSIKRAIRKAAERSGVACSPHVFRHTAAVWMAQADVAMQKIAQFLGHTSTRVTERTYARYSPGFMRDAAAALDW